MKNAFAWLRGPAAPAPGLYAYQGWKKPGFLQESLANVKVSTRQAPPGES